MNKQDYAFSVIWKIVLKAANFQINVPIALIITLKYRILTTKMDKTHMYVLDAK